MLRTQTRARAALAALAAALALPALAAAAERPQRPAEDLETQAWLNSLPEAEIRPALARLVAAAGTTNYYAVSPGSLVVRDPENEHYLFEATTPGAIDSHNGLVGFPCFYAPVRLPQRAVVTGLVVWTREDDDQDLHAALHRKAVGSLGNSEVMATVSSSGASTTLQILTDLTIANATVENRSFYYYAEVCLPTHDTELHGVYLIFEK